MISGVEFPLVEKIQTLILGAAELQREEFDKRFLFTVDAEFPMHQTCVLYAETLRVCIFSTTRNS